jgi:hypothetical protein
MREEKKVREKKIKVKVQLGFNTVIKIKFHIRILAMKRSGNKKIK